MLSMRKRGSLALLALASILLFSNCAASDSSVASHVTATPVGTTSSVEPTSTANAPNDELSARLRSALGIFTFLGLCYLLSTARKPIRWRTVGWGLGLQFLLGLLILKTT